MDAVVDLGEGALEVPIELEAVVFLVLEAAKFPDQVNFELGADPHTEFKSDIGMGEGAAVASGSGFKTDGVGFLNSFLYADLVTVESCLTSNCGEFAVIKIGVENGLPNAQKLDGIPIAEPVRNEKFSVLRLEHVGKGDVVALLPCENGNGSAFDLDGGYG